MGKSFGSRVVPTLDLSVQSSLRLGEFMMSNGFERRWQSEFEQRALRSIIPPRAAGNLKSPEDVHHYGAYMADFEAKHAVYWKWVLMWMAYPVLVVPLIAVQTYSNLRQENPILRSLFLSGQALCLMGALYIGALIGMHTHWVPVLSQFIAAEDHLTVFSEAWCHLNVLILVALVLAVALERKRTGSVWGPLLKSLVFIAFYLLGYRLMPIQTVGSEGALVYAWFFSFWGFAWIGRHRFWTFPTGQLSEGV